jgi:NAD(P)-dependent dehydrogenase (short-subunit alcohol dehydrogenase family)
LAAGVRFLAEGASLVVTGRTADEGPPALTVLESLGSVRFLAGDATDPRNVEVLVQESVSFLGGLDVLYHIAGGSGRRHGDGPLHECTDDGWQYTLDANLKSVFLSNRTAVRQFLSQRQGGAILNLASVLALAPSPRHFDPCAYTAAKGGIIALSRLAAARYAPNGIRVNVLAPGLIDTPMAVRACQDPAILDFLRAKQPLSRGPGQPDDCSAAAVFLCSDAAHFITGAVLPVDGGWCVSEGEAVRGLE